MVTARNGPNREVINDDVTITGTHISIRDLHVNGYVEITNLRQSILSGIFARDGFRLIGDVGAGIYGNVFIAMDTGLVTGPAVGWDVYTVDPLDQNRVNGNTFIGCSARFCATTGFQLVRASGNWIVGFQAETCGNGMTATTAVRTTLVGGYFEGNTTTDIELLAGTSHFRMFGTYLNSTNKLTGANKDATGNVYEESSVFRTIGTHKPTGVNASWIDFLKADESTIRLDGE